MRKPRPAVVYRSLHVSEAIEVITIPNVKPPGTSARATDAEVGHMGPFVPPCDRCGLGDGSDNFFVSANFHERSEDVSGRRLYPNSGNPRRSSCDLQDLCGIEDSHPVPLIYWHRVIPLSSAFRTTFFTGSVTSFNTQIQRTSIRLAPRLEGIRSDLRLASLGGFQ